MLCCISVWLGASFTYDWASGWWSLGALGLSQQFQKNPCHPISTSRWCRRKDIVAEESTCRSRTQSRLLCSTFPLEELQDFAPGWLKGQKYLLLLWSPQWVQKSYSILFEEKGRLRHCNTKYLYETLERHKLIRISENILNLLFYKLPSYAQICIEHSHYVSKDIDIAVCIDCLGRRHQ